MLNPVEEEYLRTFHLTPQETRTPPQPPVTDRTPTATDLCTTLAAAPVRDHSPRCHRYRSPYGTSSSAPHTSRHLFRPPTRTTGRASPGRFTLSWGGPNAPIWVRPRATVPKCLSPSVLATVPASFFVAHRAVSTRISETAKPDKFMGRETSKLCPVHSSAVSMAFDSRPRKFIDQPTAVTSAHLLPLRHLPSRCNPTLVASPNRLFRVIGVSLSTS